MIGTKHTTALLRPAAALALAIGAAGALGTGAAVAAPAPAPTPAEAAAAHDLAPHLTVSGMKAPGYAGSVALRLSNVGSERYYGDYPVVSFRIDVTTEKGPEGVDRVITPSGFHGAHVRDLGFDERTSTRSFLVTLSNPVEKGEDQLVGALSFGDGATREGRLVNSVTVTQVGRLADDTSTGNDQGVRSQDATTLDTGGTSAGLF